MKVLSYDEAFTLAAKESADDAEWTYTRVPFDEVKHEGPHSISAKAREADEYYVVEISGGRVFLGVL